MSRQPNVILIYTDQQRHDTIHALGADWMETPNLDRLCSEGTAYTNATTPSPVCMPARWSLHTGQWPHNHRCYSNHHPGPLPAYSLPGLLREVGYRTALIGKNHSFLGPEDWDVFDTAPERSAPDQAALAARERVLSEPSFARLYPDAAPGGLRGDPEVHKTDAALRFIEESTDGPFFLWLSYLNPHTPYVAIDKFLELYEDKPIPAPVVESDGLSAAGKPFRQIFHQRNNDAVMPFDDETVMRMRRVYYAMISLIDHEVGRVMDALDSAGRREDTLIIFTSDHGDYMGDHGLLTKSPALYDCLVRVPFVASLPGTVAEGERSGDFVSHIDILPAVLGLAGQSVDSARDSWGRHVDGRDFLRLHGHALRRAAYSEYGIPGRPYDEWALRQAGYAGRAFTNPGDAGLPWEGNPVSLSGQIRMIRTEDWKLVEEPEGTDELYDLSQDPNELENIHGRPGTESRKAELHRLFDAVQRRRAG